MELISQVSNSRVLRVEQSLSSRAQPPRDELSELLLPKTATNWLPTTARLTYPQPDRVSQKPLAVFFPTRNIAPQEPSPAPLSHNFPHGALGWVVKSHPPWSALDNSLHPSYLTRTPYRTDTHRSNRHIHHCSQRTNTRLPGHKVLILHTFAGFNKGISNCLSGWDFFFFTFLSVYFSSLNWSKYLIAWQSWMLGMQLPCLFVFKLNICESQVYFVNDLVQIGNQDQGLFLVSKKYFRVL